jgi:ankyrin repeat protein
MTSSAAELFTEAIETGDSAAVQSLLESGSIDVNAPLIDTTAPPLVRAAKRGHRDIVSLLLSAGARVNDADERGQTACHVAAQFGRVQIVELLALSHAADLSALDLAARTPLDAAIAASHDAVVLLLIGAGAPLDNRNTVCKAAAMGSDIVAALVDRGVVVNRELRDDGGATPLHHASTRHHDRALMNLLVNTYACDLEARHSSGSTCCHIACIYGNEAQVRWLIDAGADLESANDLGLTPLHLACSTGSVSCGLLLLAAGACVHARSGDGRTACHLALSPTRKDAFSAKMTFVHALLAAGADLDAKNQLGFTPRQLLVEQSLAVDSDAVAAARRRIARLQLEFVRDRAFQVCVGLQPLGLDALQTCEILAHACGRVAPFVPIHLWWKIATTTKHFTAHQAPARDQR